jgi:hypothetical protein
MRTVVVCGALMALGMATAEGAQSFHSADAMLPGSKLLVAGAMGKDLSEAYDVGFCAGTVSAIVSLTRGYDMCPSSSVTQGQILQVVIRYVEARPQRVHEEFGPLAIEALRDGWPCKQ